MTINTTNPSGTVIFENEPENPDEEEPGQSSFRIEVEVEVSTDVQVRNENKKETAIAQAKQEIIRTKFVEWVWKDPARRERLCRIYNDKFNSIRPRVYDGSHFRFPGMNPEITLRKLDEVKKEPKTTAKQPPKKATKKDVPEL